MEQTTPESRIIRIQTEKLTREEILRLKEIASQIEIIPDQFYPDTHSVCTPELKIDYLPISTYLKKKLDAQGISTVQSLNDHAVTPAFRIEFAELVGVSEKTANMLLIFVNLLETFEEDRDKVFVDFTRDLFTELVLVPGININMISILRSAFAGTVCDLEEIMSHESEKTELAEKTKMSQTALFDLLKKEQEIERLPETEEDIKKRFSIDVLPIMYELSGFSDTMVEGIWKGYTGPRTLEALRERTKTVKQIEEIQKASKIKSFGILPRMADLMSVPRMTPEDAFKLLSRGINSAKELANVEFLRDGVIQNVSFGIPNTRIIPYIIAAREIDETGFEPFAVSDDPEMPATPAEEIESDSKMDLPEMLTQLGRGIGQAQRELDLNALKMQKEILKSRDLTEYGLQPTWYSMPEVDFTLKMEYNVASERSEDGTVSPGRVEIIPVNAKYTSLFTSAAKEESSLTIKFVPIPPSEVLVRRREVPDMTGMTAEEAKTALSERGIRPIFYTAIDMPPEYAFGDDRTEITYQSVKSGEYLGIGEEIFVLATFRRQARAA
ncbi:helix-hairpin-helix protein [Methanimicrococcus blatticola]|uniref:Helix-hairpin-helix protein n=1 Tax=Methanimicrococcus blatticola TaxID=91560 RepID=A0A484F7F9_9EURY|nr:helix-hairpin-helix protein [Methanimicrococcus blatticola]